MAGQIPVTKPSTNGVYCSPETLRADYWPEVTKPFVVRMLVGAKTSLSVTIASHIFLLLWVEQGGGGGNPLSPPQICMFRASNGRQLWPTDDSKPISCISTRSTSSGWFSALLA